MMVYGEDKYVLNTLTVGSLLCIKEVVIVYSAHKSELCILHFDRECITLLHVRLVSTYQPHVLLVSIPKSITCERYVCMV